MNIVLSQWHESTTCAWCEKSRECVTTNFGSGFIKNSALCWKCLQQAVKMDARQREAGANVKGKAASE